MPGSHIARSRPMNEQSIDHGPCEGCVSFPARGPQEIVFLAVKTSDRSGSHAKTVDGRLSAVDRRGSDWRALKSGKHCTGLQTGGDAGESRWQSEWAFDASGCHSGSRGARYRLGGDHAGGDGNRRGCRCNTRRRSIRRGREWGERRQLPGAMRWSPKIMSTVGEWSVRP
jgi:hypothetical protein